MRIDQLAIQNFRCFDEKELAFDRDFTVIVGKNGSGKTAVLEALAVAVGSWLLGVPGHSSRGILNEDVRRVPQLIGDQLNFETSADGTRIEAQGAASGKSLSWARSRKDKGRTTTAEANPLRDLAQHAYGDAQPATLPVIAYYGAGRLWQSSRLSKEPRLKRQERNRSEGYELAIDPRCNPRTLQQWMRLQAQIRFEEGQETTGLKAVRQAMTSMTDGAQSVDYRARWDDIVVFFENDSQPFSRLSAGQRNTLALSGDLAMRMNRLNPHLGSQALNETPGVVLIDEIDLHLHPEWQRHVVDDLRRSFPRVQFIATTHSPFIIQSLRDGELIDLEEPDPPLPADYADQSIEDIVEQVMHVRIPQKSQRYLNMMDAAREYFILVRSDATQEAIDAAKRRLDEVSFPFSDYPGLHALLAIERQGSNGAQ